MSRRMLPLDVRRQLQAIATPVLKDKGTVLLQKGQPCRRASRIRGAQVQLSIGTGPSLYPARTVDSGFIGGLPATFSGEPYSLTAETKIRCRLEFIPRQKLLSLLHQNPDAGLQILRLLSEEIFYIRKLVNNDGRSSRISPRVERRLERIELKVAGSCPIDLFLTENGHFIQDTPVRTMGLMRDSSIAARTEELRREIVLIQQQEHRYRSHKNHSLAENAEHHKREFRILAIREELRALVEKLRNNQTATVWYS